MLVNPSRKATNTCYDKSDKGKARQARYNNSNKGRMRYKRREGRRIKIGEKKHLFPSIEIAEQARELRDRLTAEFRAKQAAERDILREAEKS